ncbi:hypothetical protein PTQ35_03975 [Campylobacter sp. 46490-21]|nr:hypothetical protein [Campylobacter magnus]MDD0847975.1 hypothetical protein [Campylobacter magnus]
MIFALKAAALAVGRRSGSVRRNFATAFLALAQKSKQKFLRKAQGCARL